MVSLIDQQRIAVANSELLPEITHSQTLLKKISDNWYRRAQVTKVKDVREQNKQLDRNFETQRDDFPIELLPFRDHPLFAEAPIELQKKVLSCGWIAYNQKTVDIETKLISPACNHIIYGEVPGSDNAVARQSASDTLVDEAYHTQLVVAACNITRQHRGLQYLRLPSFKLIREMEILKEAQAERWQKILIQMVTAIVSEIFISDYLELLSKDTEILPFNRLTVATHLQDEKAHHSIFKILAKSIYAHLNLEQKQFFAEILPQPIRWFANQELEVWLAMLQQIDFPHAEQIIGDCLTNLEINLQRIDYSEITSLAYELGILDNAIYSDCFFQAGLL